MATVIAERQQTPAKVGIVVGLVGIAAAGIIVALIATHSIGYQKGMRIGMDMANAYQDSPPNNHVNIELYNDLYKNTAKDCSKNNQFGGAACRYSLNESEIKVDYLPDNTLTYDENSEILGLVSSDVDLTNLLGQTNGSFQVIPSSKGFVIKFPRKLLFKNRSYLARPPTYPIAVATEADAQDLLAQVGGLGSYQKDANNMYQCKWKQNFGLYDIIRAVPYLSEFTIPHNRMNERDQLSAWLYGGYIDYKVNIKDDKATLIRQDQGVPIYEAQVEFENSTNRKIFQDLKMFTPHPNQKNQGTLRLTERQLINMRYCDMPDYLKFFNKAKFDEFLRYIPEDKKPRIIEKDNEFIITSRDISYPFVRESREYAKWISDLGPLQICHVEASQIARITSIFGLAEIIQEPSQNSDNHREPLYTLTWQVDSSCPRYPMSEEEPIVKLIPQEEQHWCDYTKPLLNEKIIKELAFSRILLTHENAKWCLEPPSVLAGDLNRLYPGRPITAVAGGWHLVSSPVATQ